MNYPAEQRIEAIEEMRRLAKEIEERRREIIEYPIVKKDYTIEYGDEDMADLVVKKTDTLIFSTLLKGGAALHRMTNQQFTGRIANGVKPEALVKEVVEDLRRALHGNTIHATALKEHGVLSIMAGIRGDPESNEALTAYENRIDLEKSFGVYDHEKDEGAVFKVDKDGKLKPKQEPE